MSDPLDNETETPASAPQAPPSPAHGAFVASLVRNNKQIKADRAEAIGESAQMIYRRTIEDLHMDIRQMERDQENMLDMSPDNAMSLKLASDFNAAQYVEKDVELGVRIRNAKIKLKIATDRYEYLFGNGGA